MENPNPKPHSILKRSNKARQRSQHLSRALRRKVKFLLTNNNNVKIPPNRTNSKRGRANTLASENNTNNGTSSPRSTTAKNPVNRLSRLQGASYVTLQVVTVAKPLWYAAEDLCGSKE